MLFLKCVPIYLYLYKLNLDLCLTIEFTGVLLTTIFTLSKCVMEFQWLPHFRPLVFSRFAQTHLYFSYRVGRLDYKQRKIKKHMRSCLYNSQEALKLSFSFFLYLSSGLFLYFTNKKRSKKHPDITMFIGYVS